MVYRRKNGTNVLKIRRRVLRYVAVDVERKMELTFLLLGATYYGMWQSMIIIMIIIIFKTIASQDSPLVPYDIVE